MDGLREVGCSDFRRKNKYVHLETWVSGWIIGNLNIVRIFEIHTQKWTIPNVIFRSNLDNYSKSISVLTSKSMSNFPGGGVTRVKTYVNMYVQKVFKWTHISEVHDPGITPFSDPLPTGRTLNSEFKVVHNNCKTIAF